ncbi:MAG TPA: hypothetical protein PKE40_14460 [Arachnia sp.]|nr:hypothetical protein [Arachnia sp.]
MATWRDGAAYAPATRPDGFAAPVAPALSAAAPRDPGTPRDVPAPATMEAPAQMAPLEAVAAQPRTARNPREAFAVASALLTAASTERDPRQPILTSAPRQILSDDELPPPTGAPLAPPMGDPFAPPETPATPSTWPETGPVTRVSPQPQRSPQPPLSPQQQIAPQPGSPLPPVGGPNDWPAPAPIQAGPPGQWQQLPTPPPPALTTPQRTIAGVCMFLFTVAVLFPATTAILVTVAGGLLLRLPGRLGSLGRTAVVAGGLWLAWGIATDTLLDGGLLLRIIAAGLLTFTIVNTLKPANNARP